MASGLLLPRSLNIPANNTTSSSGAYSEAEPALKHPGTGLRILHRDRCARSWPGQPSWNGPTNQRPLDEYLDGKRGEAKELRSAQCCHHERIVQAGKARTPPGLIRLPGRNQAHKQAQARALGELQAPQIATSQASGG